MRAYILAQINIHDRKEYELYLDGFDEIFARYHGMVLAVDEKPVVLEGEWPYRRTVLMSFRNEEDARNWYHSPEYQEIAKHRRKATVGNIVMVKR